MTNADNLREYKNTISTTLEQILAVASNHNMVKKSLPKFQDVVLRF